MSEYWVSHKRYHCKYCNIYIADDRPSRQQHENGLRHKGNVERFVRGLYKDGEKRVREREEERGIMASIGKAADAAYALDVASGRAGAGSSREPRGMRPTAAPKQQGKVAKPSDPYENYSTAMSLGYGDPDAEAAQQRVHAGTPGEWTVVDKSATVGEKRRAGEEGEKGEREEEEGDVRAFKLRKKTASVGLGEVYDPGVVESNRAGSKAEKDEPGEAEPSLFRKRKARRDR